MPMYSCFTCTSIWSLMLCMLSLSAKTYSHIHNTRHLVLLIHGLLCSLRAKSICPLNFRSNTQCITIYFRGKAPSYEAAEKRAGLGHRMIHRSHFSRTRESHRVTAGEVGGLDLPWNLCEPATSLHMFANQHSIALVASHPPACPNVEDLLPITGSASTVHRGLSAQQQTAWR